LIVSVTIIVCYSWFTQVIGIIKPKALNECFIKWVMNDIKDGMNDAKLTVDGKTVRSTVKMKKNTKNPYT